MVCCVVGLVWQAICLKGHNHQKMRLVFMCHHGLSYPGTESVAIFYSVGIFAEYILFEQTVPTVKIPNLLRIKFIVSAGSCCDGSACKIPLIRIGIRP
jgi:hypothetical protein